MLKIAVFASGRGSNFQAIIDQIKRAKIPAEIKFLLSDQKNAGALKKAEKEGINSTFIDPAQFETELAYEKN